MTSLYKQSIPYFIKYLNNLSGILKKGEAFANEKAIKHEDMLNYELTPGMKGLPYSVTTCCNGPVLFVDRVTGLEHVKLPDDEKTFEQLQARIEKTVAWLNKVDPKTLDDKVDTPFTWQSLANGEISVEGGQVYLSEFCMPYFYHQASTVYCNLIAQGVPLSAADYLKDVFKRD